ncbi:hypothetical protein [Streptomyces sp. NPDC059753]|uniref:hypothetical protein n=1 Tax=Streptomyces sp. NPDC059753 TaxID=3346933 RepID=UPI00365E00B7
MSARDELFDHIESLSGTVRSEFCMGCDCAPSDRAEANQLIDAFAHELAEKIREANRAVTFSDAFYVGTGMTDAANLIDPEVEA